MATGFFALLDDIAAIAKVAAASLDDAAAQAAKAGGKAAGIVIDDAAVTPRYVVGFAADRELPVIRRIAVGSLKNKLLILTPGALLLAQFAKPLLTPLLMAGGAFLCVEGFHKARDLVRPPAPAQADAAEPADPAEVERARVESAVRTDFILSAEIMAITLSTVSTASLGLQAAVLVLVGVAMTVLVYGAVALIVKADDLGAAMARAPHRLIRALGGGLVRAMPGFLGALSMVGLVAMLWVGGGIVVHGLHELGVHGPEAAVGALATRAGALLPGASAALRWLVSTAASALIGLALGAAVDVAIVALLQPAWRRLRARRRG